MSDKANNIIDLAEEALKRGITRHNTIKILKDNEELIKQAALEEDLYKGGYNIDVNLFDNKIIPTRDEEGIWEDDGGLPPHNED